MAAARHPLRLLGIRVIWSGGLLLACGMGGSYRAVPAGWAALAPLAGEVATGGSRTFTLPAAAGGAAVAWAVDSIPGGGPAVGTLRGSGATVSYTAPAVPGSHLLTATSRADPALVAHAAITVLEPCTPPPAASATDVKARPYSAKGDGATDDTAAIQRAINAVAGTGGTVRIPDGTYLINTVASSDRGLVLGSRMTLELAPGAVLKAIPNAAANSTIVSVAFASKVNVVGGTLLGDREAHTGTAGEWGMGLSIQDSSEVTVNRVTARECWGDGFYVHRSAKVELCSVLAEHNRRNGLSITGCAGITVRGSTFRNSRGTAPEDGLDIEPNAGDTVSDALVTGCLFSDNAGSGLEAGVGDSDLGRAFTDRLVIDGNTFTGNGKAPADGTVKMGIRVSNSPGTRVTGNVILNQTGQGIYLRYRSWNCLVAGNSVALTAGDGIVQASCSGNLIQGNRVTRNSGHGINSTNCVGGEVSGNTVSGNGRSP